MSNSFESKSRSRLNMTDLELESVESGPDNCCNLLRKLSTRKITWVIVTALVTALCYASARPVACHDSTQCRQYHDAAKDLNIYSAFIECALGSVFLHEMVSVILMYRTAKKAIHLIPNIKDSLLPSTLLCITFAVLLVENLPFFTSDTPWFVHAANLGRSDLDHQPVYTIFFAEWLINVPILIILAGTVALGRPAQEVAEPLIVTNVYMTFAWTANFIPNEPIRYTLVSVSFLMYFRASWTMVLWVARWRRKHPEGQLLGRPLLSFALVLVFGIYGIVYLLRLRGAVSYRGERIFYTTMNFTTKLFASMTLSGIRSSEFQEVLLTMLANTQTSFKRAVNYEETAELLP